MFRLARMKLSKGQKHKSQRMKEVTNYVTFQFIGMEQRGGARSGMWNSVRGGRQTGRETRGMRFGVRSR